MWEAMFKGAGSSLEAAKSKAVAPIPCSYLGGTPTNHYEPNYALPVTIDLAQKNVHNDGSTCKIFIRSGGKSMSTPVQLAKNNAGVWKLKEFSSIYTGVQPDHDKGDF